MAKEVYWSTNRYVFHVSQSCLAAIVTLTKLLAKMVIDVNRALFHRMITHLCDSIDQIDYFFAIVSLDFGGR